MRFRVLVRRGRRVLLASAAKPALREPIRRCRVPLGRRVRRVRIRLCRVLLVSAVKPGRRVLSAKPAAREIPELPERRAPRVHAALRAPREPPEPREIEGSQAQPVGPDPRASQEKPVPREALGRREFQARRAPRAAQVRSAQSVSRAHLVLVSDSVGLWRRWMTYRRLLRKVISITWRLLRRRMAGCGMTLSGRGLMRARFRGRREVLVPRAKPEQSALPEFRASRVWRARTEPRALMALRAATALTVRMEPILRCRVRLGLRVRTALMVRMAHRVPIQLFPARPE